MSNNLEHLQNRKCETSSVSHGWKTFRFLALTTHGDNDYDRVQFSRHEIAFGACKRQCEPVELCRKRKNVPPRSDFGMRSRLRDLVVLICIVLIPLHVVSADQGPNSLFQVRRLEISRIISQGFMVTIIKSKKKCMVFSLVSLRNFNF